jgi:hypothetical protein
MTSQYLMPLPTVHGKVERPAPWDRWWVPSVTLDGNRLRWDIGSGAWTRAGPGLLDGFLRLADAGPEAILRYAQRWGVFGICSHGLPSSHNRGPTPHPLLTVGEPPWCRPQGHDQGTPWEETQLWNDYARAFRALVSIAARLHDGDRSRHEDWAALNVTPTAPWLRRDERAQLAVVLTQFLEQGGVRPAISWKELADRPLLGFAGAGLFGALTMQLVLACAGSDGLALCSGCGVAYLPPRQPSAGTRRYCPECRRRKVDQRDAARAYRQRKKPRNEGKAHAREARGAARAAAVPRRRTP